jgi:glyoxylase-like metal-dependent hydrolase (beta-lactamase superfamily II)
MQTDCEIIGINENSFRIENNGVRMFLLLGTKKALLIDSGMTAEKIKDTVKSITSLPVELFNTHADPDHISGNIEFDKFYMHPAEEENYRNHGGKGTIIPVCEDDVIDLGERPLRVIDLCGHTPGSVSLMDEKARVLISGDPIQYGTIFMFGKMRNMNRYIESLKKLERHRHRFDEIWPSHGAFPLKNDAIDFVRGCADKIVSGDAEGQQVVFHGNTIIRYDFEKTVFLCDQNHRRENK